MEKKLLLCAGPRFGPPGGEGWFRVDIDPRVEPDLVASVIPLPDQVREMAPWDKVCLIHGIEHFTEWDAFDLLCQVREILKPGGVLIMEQPNLEVCVQHLDNPVYYGGIYGDVRRREPGMRHLSGHTPKSLTAMVMRAGYSESLTREPLFHHPERDFRLVATR